MTAAISLSFRHSWLKEKIEGNFPKLLQQKKQVNHCNARLADTYRKSLGEKYVLFFYRLFRFLITLASNEKHQEKSEGGETYSN